MNLIYCNINKIAAKYEKSKIMLKALDHSDTVGVVGSNPIVPTKQIKGL